jgi:hypothetical protein
MTTESTMPPRTPSTADPWAQSWPALLLPAESGARQAQLAGLDEAQWRWLIEQAQRHAVASLLYVSLQSDARDLPRAQAALETLRASHRQAAFRALRHAAELRQVLDALASVDVCPVVYKGAALAHTLYPSPACRLMGDIDLWVTHEEMPKAISALTALGYRMHEKAHRPHAMTQQTDGEVQMLAGRPGQGLVELHWGVFPGEWIARTTAVDRAGVRSRLVTGQLVGRPAYLLAPEDALIQLVIHISINQQMTRNALRSLADIALSMQQPLDWTLIGERASAWRVATATGLTLELTRRLFGLSALPEAAQRLVPQGVQRFALERFVSPQTILDGRRLSADARRFLYLLSVTDRARDSLRLVGHTLWPHRDWLAARYGRSDWRMRMRHAAQSVSGSP